MPYKHIKLLKKQSQKSIFHLNGRDEFKKPALSPYSKNNHLNSFP